MSMGGCVISKNILNGKGNLRWCVREEGVNEVDNGWRFLSDVDTDEYLSDADNMSVFNFEDLIELEPSVLLIYDLPVGSEVTFVEDDNRKFFLDSKTNEEIIFE